MRPVLVTNAAYPQAYLHRDDPDPFVPNLAVDDVVDLLDLVRRPGSTAPVTAVCRAVPLRTPGPPTARPPGGAQPRPVELAS
jgi:hypothetical protein